MPDVFLIKLEPDHDHYQIAPPFGILYLSSALERDGFNVKLYHQRGTPQTIQSIVEDVVKAHPLFVGISTMTGPSLFPSMLFSKQVKAKTNIPIIWGGLHPTMMPEQTLSYSMVDLVAVGEGEETIVELAKMAAARDLTSDALRTIQGIGYRDNGEIRINPSRPFVRRLDDYSPAWHCLNIENYFYRGKFFYSEFGSKLPGDRIAAFFTSRGCPGRCGYCYNQFVNHRSFRAHSASKVIHDIEDLKRRYQITAVIFEDDCFFADKKRALDIISKLTLPWSASIRADYAARWGEDFIQYLHAHHCVELRVGAESGSQRILDIMHKDIMVEDIYQTVELCRKQGINALLNFMIGIPGESWADILMTLQVMDHLEGQGVIVNGPSLYLPYPGTPLFDAAVKMGFNPPRCMEDWGVQWGPQQPLTPFVDKRAQFIGYYRTLAFRKDTSSLKVPLFAEILKFLARKRWEKRYFRFPLDYSIPHLAWSFLKSFGLKKVARALYD